MLLYIQCIARLYNQTVWPKLCCSSGDVRIIPCLRCDSYLVADKGLTSRISPFISRASDLISLYTNVLGLGEWR